MNMKTTAKFLSEWVKKNQGHFVKMDFLEKWKLAISLNTLIERKSHFIRVMVGNKT